MRRLLVTGGAGLIGVNFVQFAAEPHSDNSLRDPSPFVTTDAVGTFTVLDAARRHGVRSCGPA